MKIICILNNYLDEHKILIILNSIDSNWNPGQQKNICKKEFVDLLVNQFLYEELPNI